MLGKRLEVPGHRMNEVRLFFKTVTCFGERARSGGRSFKALGELFPGHDGLGVTALKMKRGGNESVRLRRFIRRRPSAQDADGIGSGLIVLPGLNRKTRGAKKQSRRARVRREGVHDANELFARSGIVIEALLEDFRDAHACVESLDAFGERVDELLVPPECFGDTVLAEVKVGELSRPDECSTLKFGVGHVVELGEDAVYLSERIFVPTRKGQVARTLKHRLRIFRAPGKRRHAE